MVDFYELLEKFFVVCSLDFCQFVFYLVHEPLIMFLDILVVAPLLQNL